jgi:hypothetical protein
MRKAMIWYPHTKGLEWEVEFEEDEELYQYGVCIQSIRFDNSTDLYTEFTESAIERMEAALAKALRVAA